MEWGKVVSCRARFSLLAAALVLSCASLAAAFEGASVGRQPASPSRIVLGFVGGFVRHDNARHSTVQLAERIRESFASDASDVHVQVFENRHRRAAFETITRLLDCNHDGKLSAAEKARAQIILYGHSWGASAAVALARDLNRAGIPVLLTVQIDSIAKPGQNDSLIPPNVAEAVNFYQPHGLLHGRPEIKAADASRTKILGNYLFDYKRNPVQCDMSWMNRTFMLDHIESECDRTLWTRVESLVRQRLDGPSGPVAEIAH